MSEIHEDIGDTAEKIVRSLRRDSTDIATVALALQAERRRCYRICIDQAGRHAAYKSGHDEAEAARACAKRINAGEVV